MESIVFNGFSTNISCEFSYFYAKITSKMPAASIESLLRPQ